MADAEKTDPPHRHPGYAGSRLRTADQDTDPPYLYPDYGSTRRRAPARPLVFLQHGPSEQTGPVLGGERFQPGDADLTTQHAGEPIGQRIVVSGRIVDSDGLPVRDSLVEVWQANAAGRYRHEVDDHPAPLDPNFTGLGRTLTDHEGRYRFVTIKPGAYPWRNHPNAWRPAHIHFSVFGSQFPQRLVTQMYFEGDPLFYQDPIFNSIPEEARPLVVARLDMDTASPDWALAHRFDIVLRGRRATPIGGDDD